MQADNTVKEIRNTFTMRGLCSLVSHGIYKVATLGHLAVGHTHEDVDGIFSLCASALKASPDLLQTPRDIQRALQDRLGPVFAKRGQRFTVDILGVDSRMQSYNFYTFLPYDKRF